MTIWIVVAIFVVNWLLAAVAANYLVRRFLSVAKGGPWPESPVLSAVTRMAAFLVLLVVCSLPVYFLVGAIFDD